MRTTPPATPNPFTWRGFANVRMGDYLLGEDTVDLASLGFCGVTETVSCSLCGEVLGHIPVELVGEEFETSPQPTSLPFSIGTTRNITRAALDPPRSKTPKEIPP